MRGESSSHPASAIYLRPSDVPCSQVNPSCGPMTATWTEPCDSGEALSLPGWLWESVVKRGLHNLYRRTRRGLGLQLHDRMLAWHTQGPGLCPQHCKEQTFKEEDTWAQGSWYHLDCGYPKPRGCPHLSLGAQVLIDGQTP